MLELLNQYDGNKADVRQKYGLINPVIYFVSDNNIIVYITIIIGPLIYL